MAVNCHVNAEIECKLSERPITALKPLNYPWITREMKVQDMVNSDNFLPVCNITEYVFCGKLNFLKL